MKKFILIPIFALASLSLMAQVQVSDATIEAMKKQMSSDMGITQALEEGKKLEATVASMGITPGETPGMSTEACKAHYLKNGATKENEDGLLHDGTPQLKSCLKLSDQKLPQLYSKNAKRQEGVIKWEAQLNYNCCAKEEGAREQCVKELAVQAARCDAAAFLLATYDRDFSNTDHAEEKSAQGNSAVQAGNTVQSQQNAMQALAMSSITCKSSGVETVDYEGCKKFSDALMLGDSLTTLANTGQEVIFQGKAMDAQIKYMKEENSATGALKAQKEGLELQQDMYNQRAAIDGAKLATYTALYNSIPKLKDVKEKCQSYEETTIAAGVMATKKTCEEIVGSKGKFAFTQNQAALDSMKTKLINAAASLGSNLLLAKLTGDRADDVSNAITSIDSFTPTDPLRMEQTEAQTTLCAADPEADGCKDIGLGTSFDTLSDNVIVFGSNGAGSNFGTTGSDQTSTVTDPDTDAKKGTADRVGAIVKDIDKSGEMEASSAAKVTSKPNGESGGGGGAGGGGGGMGGGGSSDAPAQAGGVTAAVQGKTPNYGGGTGFSLTGGMGLNNRKPAKAGEENPFGKLFNKDGPKSEQVNFRDLASTKVGNKNEDIFKMISDRYNRVSAEKRLLEYELTK